VNAPSEFRGYSLKVTIGSASVPSSGYSNIGAVASAIADQLHFCGRGLSTGETSEVFKDLAEWATDPTKPWTFTHQDATITVRLTERFTGWGPDMRPL
jgi:hypothetical protein